MLLWKYTPEHLTVSKNVSFWVSLKYSDLDLFSQQMGKQFYSMIFPFGEQRNLLSRRRSRETQKECRRSKPHVWGRFGAMEVPGTWRPKAGIRVPTLHSQHLEAAHFTVGHGSILYSDAMESASVSFLTSLYWLIGLCVQWGHTGHPLWAWSCPWCWKTPGHASESDQVLLSQKASKGNRVWHESWWPIPALEAERRWFRGGFLEEVTFKLRPGG